uniref:Ribosomal protein S21 n=1 Tax=Lobosphaera incisa TaxID=312850 RepID=A0A1X9QDS2_9CHLO|nr:ribosomal protein S21 [Lobosphaera incisa]
MLRQAASSSLAALRATSLQACGNSAARDAGSNVMVSSTMAQHCWHQQRGLKVPVQNNNVDKAFSQLSRKLRAEGMIDKWRDQVEFTKPALRRVLNQKETAHRLKVERFRALMSWVLKRKARGF